MTRVPACVAVASVTCMQPENNHGSRESVPVNTPARRRPAIFLPVLFATLLPVAVLAQTEQGWDVEGLNQVIPGAPAGGVTYDFASGAATGTNIFVKYGNSTLMADGATVNQKNRIVVDWGRHRNMVEHFVGGCSSALSRSLRYTGCWAYSSSSSMP